MLKEIELGSFLDQFNLNDCILISKFRRNFEHQKKILINPNSYVSYLTYSL